MSETEKNKHMGGTASEELFERIKKEKVSMKPKEYFVAQTVGIYVLLAVLFIISLFLMSLAVLAVREFGLTRMFSSGLGGIWGAFMAFPWHIALILALLAWLALLLFIRSVGRAYKLPYAILLLLIVMGIMIAVFGLTNIPEYVEFFYEKGMSAYHIRSFGLLRNDLPARWAIGIVTDMRNGMFEIETGTSGDTRRFMVDDEDILRNVIPGDRVLVRYDGDDGKNRAVFVEELESPASFTPSGSNVK